MTRYELLKALKPMLTTMARQGINQRDIIFLDLFEQYEKMLKEGNKVTYIVVHLGEVYHMDKATVFRVIKRFKENLSL